jgi:flagellar motor switch protein FliM
MAEVLSQSEVESLLAALDPSSQITSAQPAVRSEPGGNISVYDFKRPERVSKEQIRAFQALHEGFSRELGAALSGMLRTIVEVKLISVDQLTYSEFVFSLENPTCFNLIFSEGLGGHFILDINPSIIFPVIDRLLGGGKGPKHGVPARALTEIELRLVKRITDLVIKGLEHAWSNICKLQLRISQVESNPQLVQIVPPNEVIVLVTFEMTMGEMRGIINLCVPFNTIEPLSGKLSADAWSAYSQRVADPRQKLQLETGLSNASVQMTVQLAKTHLKAAELMQLEIGDVIVTEKDDHAAVEVFVEGRPMFQGSAGLHRGHKAVRIQRAIARPQDLVEARLTERGQGQSIDQPARGRTVL